jgi:2-polyprenyl-3-methyl-5-hydroxy-6-metoxy-1,4-benzoquinol methylase
MACDRSDVREGEMSFGHWITRIIYRRYRKTKQFFIRRKPDILSRIFFAAWAGVGHRMTSGRKVSSLDRAERRLWKQIYFHRFGHGPLYSVTTLKPVAKESHDHHWPRGTLYDNSENRRFNLKLYDYFDRRADLKVLDLGCSGGGFVKSIIEDGYIAIGIEGSDISQRLRSGEWDTCPHHLMTCDISEPFEVFDAKGQLTKFHAVTAWEVLEHIPTETIPNLFHSIAHHLTDDGIFVASIDMTPDANPVVGAVYHYTLQPKPWWLARFEEAGMVEVEHNPFETADYVRGHGRGFKDWDPADGEGFHVVMRRKQRTNILK